MEEKGVTYGRLTLVTRIAGPKWLARCECGVEKEVYRSNVVRGLTRSCGCLQLESIRQRAAEKKAAAAALYSKEERKERERVYMAAWKAQHADELKRKAAIYRAENRERLSEGKRKCYQNKREQYLSRVKAGYAADPERVIRRAREKATLRKEATPSWADMDAIKDLYRLSRRLTEKTGVKFHVDHVVPLCHPLVCGLHVHNNLRVIPADENWRKHNRFDTDIEVRSATAFP